MDPPANRPPQRMEDEEIYANVAFEIWFLRSTREYFLTRGIYPFVSEKAREDFAKNCVHMPVEEYIEENNYVRKRYVRRLKKGIDNLEPHEREAFHLADSIWYSRTVGIRIENVDPVRPLPEKECEDHQESKLSAAEDHNKGKEKVHEDHHQDPSNH